MITKISKIKSFGIFDNYIAGADLKPFGQFNLFYGWNGSGKTTLAKLLFSIEDKTIHSHFPGSGFNLSFADGTEITQKNIANNNANFKVFNKDFIERNVNFEDSKANSILILSEQKKGELDRYKEMLSTVKQKSDEYTSVSAKHDKAKAAHKKNLSKWASEIKKSFELIDTSNKTLLNYDITKLNAFISINKVKINKESVLNSVEVKLLKSAVNPSQKNNIPTVLNKLKSKEITDDMSVISELLKKNPISQQIARLKSNPDINAWVEAGINIHTNHKSENCEFCNQKLPLNKIEDLKKHFSQEYSALINSLNEKISFIDQISGLIDQTIPETSELYEEFQSNIQSAKTEFSENKNAVNEILQNALRLLKDKLSNPFDEIDHDFENSESIFDEYNNAISKIGIAITQHNKKNEGFEAELKKANEKLELHFVSEKLLAEEYTKTEADIVSESAKVELIKNDIIELQKQIKEAEASLLNEAIAADTFNKNLEKFLGRKDLSLEFDTMLKGYKIVRGGQAQPAKNLSEGEKTAVAFIYFISKLKENGNLIQDSIIVLDDPISSFDSNHLFHSYSYLKKECEAAKQLFILTHNFQYFKLVRDWLIKKNKKDAQGNQVNRSLFYSIDATSAEPRIAKIINAHSTLLKFNSEYHFIFYKLFELRDLPSLDLEKAFLVANLSRKLLEGFLTFKFPKGRANFAQLVDAGCPDKELSEKVYRFINKYSHNQEIEFHDPNIDNLAGEADNIIQSIFKIVTDLDAIHFQEIQEVCGVN